MIRTVLTEAAVSRVLVIDDEPKIISFVSRALTARGFDVDSAGNGAQGLDLMRIGGDAGVVLDLRLPGIDGVDVLRTTLEERPHQHGSVLSPPPHPATKGQGLDLRAADHITQPV